MPRMSIKALLMLVVVFALALVPFSFLFNHATTWGPAERTEDMLRDLRHDIEKVGDGSITLDKIDRQLALAEYEFLRVHKSNDVELRDSELIWFTPNLKYSLGLRKDGSIVWMINGRRAGD